MINIHHNLIREDLKIIGSDGLTVLLVIASFIGKDRSAFPKFQTIKSMSGLSKERAYKALATLQTTGYLERSQENTAGEWGKVIYRISTDKLGVWINANEFPMEEDNRLPETRHTENRNTQTRQALSIIKDKSIVKDKEYINPAPEKQKLPPAERKVKEAMLEAFRFFEEYPAQQEMMCMNAKRPDALHPEVWSATLEAWIRYNIDNPAIICHIETSITKSFQAWLTRNLEANNKPKVGLFRPAGQEAAPPAYVAPVNQKLQF